MFNESLGTVVNKKNTSEVVANVKYKKTILGRIQKMFSNTIRPRKNHSWLNAIESQHMSNSTPIFKVTDANEKSDFLSINIPHLHGETKFKSKKTSKSNKSFTKDICNHIETYCDKTTLHGLKYVGDPALSIGERIFWFISFVTAVSFAAYYILHIFDKWHNSPVIISFNPFDADLSSIPFPAITICNMNQAKKGRAHYYQNYGTELEKRILNDLCDTNISDVKGEDVPWEKLRDLLQDVGTSCEDMVKSCKWRNEVVSDCFKTFFNNDLTDEGLCCSFNRLPGTYIYRNSKEISNLNQSFGKVYDWSPEKGFTRTETGEEDVVPRRPLGAGAHLGLTIVLDALLDDYYCSSTRSVGFKIILSNPIETPKMADFGFLLNPGHESRLAIEPSIREASDSLRDIDIEKRQCYFTNERPLKYYRAYTSRNCRLECLSNYTLEQCKCVPYFLPRASFTKICETSDEHCVQKAKANMELTTGKAHSCRCFSGCHEIVYEFESSNARLFTGYDYFKTPNRTLNEIADIFVLSKLLNRLSAKIPDHLAHSASTGGLLGVFLGVSFLSLVEIAYHFSLKILCVTCISLRKKRRKEQIHEFVN